MVEKTVLCASPRARITDIKEYAQAIPGSLHYWTYSMKKKTTMCVVYTIAKPQCCQTWQTADVMKPDILSVHYVVLSRPKILSSLRFM
jgi:ribosome-associated toxin RatA of RatAB toxin-antitoxin module